MDARCFDCRFFSPGGYKTADELREEEWDECLEGECRRNPPRVGRFRGEDEHLQYDYGQWPLVQAANWCGAFEPCQRVLGTSAAQTRHADPHRAGRCDVANEPNPQSRPAVGQRAANGP